MKKIISNIIAAAAMVAVSGVAVYAEGQFTEYTPAHEGSLPALYPGVGPVMAESVTSSQLPTSATDFIRKYFPSAVVVNSTHDIKGGEYDVDLDDGTDIEFDSRGEWTEVEAGNMRRLSPAMVASLIPEKAYKELERRQMTGEVEKIKRDRNGYKVELREVKYDDYRFSRDGKLLSVKD